jgi:DNA-binding PadR family transcriptional regulator
MPLRDQIRKGSSEIIILTLLSQKPMYGYQISQELQRRSAGYFKMKEGLLYPTMHRMEKGGLVSSEWRTVTGQRRRKYYLITERGRQALTRQSAEWRTFTEKLLHLLETSPAAEGT